MVALQSKTLMAAIAAGTLLAHLHHRLTGAESG
jgi:hypothetical protein